MCGNDDRPQIQNIPDPPPEKKMMDFINHITGTESVTVTDVNGKPQRVIRRLPRRPGEEDRFQTGERLVANTINNLTKLSRYDPKSLIPFAPLVNTLVNMNQETLKDLGQVANLGNLLQDIADLRNIQRDLIDEQFNTKETALQERLAHSGRGSSTYAAEARAAMARQRGLAHQQGEVAARDNALNLAGKNLGLNANAFGLREQGRQNTIQTAQAEYGLNKADEQDQEQRRLQAMKENEGMFNLGSGLIKYDDAKALQDRTHEQALNTYLAENNVQNARYGQQVNAINANNNAAIAEYQSRPPSFMDIAGSIIGKGATSMFTAAPNTMAGRLGKKLIG